MQSGITMLCQEARLKTHYVLIDYENVQPSTMTVLAQAHFKVIVFVGTNQAKIPFEVASALQAMGSRARYIKISGNGSNALDFHIAFYIGQLVAEEPDAHFHIISKDTGFDPLIQHLKSKKVQVRRLEDVTKLSPPKPPALPAPNEKLTTIVASLRLQGAAKPRTVKTLGNAINTMFQKKLAEKEIAALVQELQKQGIVMVSDTEDSYRLPT